MDDKTDRAASATLISGRGTGWPNFDVCHYPRLDKRLYLHVNSQGRWRDFVDNADLDERGP